MLKRSVIVLEGQEYTGVLDFEVMGNVQLYFEKEHKLELTIPEIFEAIRKQKLYIVNEIVVQSIIKCHKQLKRHHILNKLELSDIEKIINYVNDLGMNSMPNSEGKSEEDMDISNQEVTTGI